ncbi:hypothetical protein C8Q76DRAFT_800707 [Earliella scabrosa]|nr:hypothetical protein C8Q76DRAFT_800707 [Earliella scabrosa]
MPDNSHFDAVKVEHGKHETVLWAFQITASESRVSHIARAGLEMLKILVRKAGTQRDRRLPVRLKYVLVVPHTETRTVRWKLPADFSEADAHPEVYLQFLDLGPGS